MDPDREGPAGTDDLTAIDALAVTAEDVVAALEARQQRDRPVVLRVTPPFSGRMRARLHVVRDETEVPAGDPAPLHVRPERFVEDPPTYPRPAETEDELRADPSVEYTVERHHDRHAAAVDDWRRQVRERFVSETRIETPDGEHHVSVTVLG